MDRPPESFAPPLVAIEFDSFDEIVNARPIVVIHFWAPWNAYDGSYSHTLRRVIPLFATTIEFRKFNMDDDRDYLVSRKAGVADNPPALVCFLRGEWVETVIGMRSDRELETRLAGWLQGVAALPVVYGPSPMRFE